MSATRRFLPGTLGAAAALALLSATDVEAQRTRPASRTLATGAPEVASASPGAVEVEPGASTRITLRGANLHLLRSATVTRSNGQAVNGFQTTMQPAITGNARRQVDITTAPGLASPTNTKLQLRVSSASESGVVVENFSVTLVPGNRVARVHEDDLIATGVGLVLAGATMAYNSCGGSNSARLIRINVAGYSASEAVPRYEREIDDVGRLSFLEKHSIDPTDIATPQQLLELPRSAHPSPFAHTVNEVRMCVVPYQTGGGWELTDVSERNGSLEATVTVQANNLKLRTRGMPAHPVLQLDGLNVGIQWGNVITDAELPDLEFERLSYEVRLPFSISNGNLEYGTARVTRNAGQPRWSSQFLGPQNIEGTMRNHANERVAQLGQEILKAVNSPTIRSQIAAAIASRLASVHGIENVVAVRHYNGAMWEVEHR